MSGRPRCAIPSSSEAVMHNPNLLTLILQRVPARPLTGLKAVSRTWRALISDRQFASGHTLLHPPTKASALLIRRSSTHFEFVSVSQTTTTSTPLNSINLRCPDILHSCNGLLLLESSPRVYNVLNPTTNQLSILPSPSSGRLKLHGISLALDPRMSPFYKVIGVRLTCKSSSHVQIHVYSSLTREWRALGAPFVVSDTSCFDEGVSCYGAVHWASCSRDGFRFDIDQERLIPMPGFIPATNYRHELSTSNGQLQLVETSLDWCHALEMPNDYYGWFFKYVIYLGQSPCFVNALLFAEGDKQDEESSIVINIQDGKVVAYDFGGDGIYTCRAICDAAGSGSPPYAHLIDVYPFFDSLTCV